MSSTENALQEQSKWATMPYKILHRIFQTLCLQEGCLPLLVRFVFNPLIVSYNFTLRIVDYVKFVGNGETLPYLHFFGET